MRQYNITTQLNKTLKIKKLNLHRISGIAQKRVRSGSVISAAQRLGNTAPKKYRNDNELLVTCVRFDQPENRTRTSRS